MTRERAYRSFQYLEPGVDHHAFELAPDVDRVPAYVVPLTKEQEARAAAIMAAHPIVSLHDHTSIFPARPEDLFAQRRQGRDATGYAGLARSGTDVFFEAFMDGTATITSNAGWKWTDVIHDLGMRLSDIAHQDRVFVALTLDDVRRAKREQRIAFVIALEAATMIENEVDRVDVLYGLGVRCMGITYSEANALGSGLKEERDGGLTELGRQVVRRMNRLGMAIDVAHAGDRTSLDVIEASERPVLITHAGARALWDTPRMKPDEVIEACARKGGVIGVEAAPHTTLTKAHPEHSIDSVMEHVEHCVRLVGADHVALGPDTLFGDHVALHKAFAQQLSIGRIHRLPYTEVAYVKGMENPGESMRNAVRWLVAHGYGDADIAKIAGGNVLRVLEQVWAR